MTARISRGKPTYYASGCPDTALTGVAYMRVARRGVGTAIPFYQTFESALVYLCFFMTSE